jgi:hypothetical protein
MTAAPIEAALAAPTTAAAPPASVDMSLATVQPPSAAL